MLVECSKCGKKISDKADKCPWCDSPIGETTYVENSEEIIHCHECGQEVISSDARCTNCGYPLSEKPQKVEIMGISFKDDKTKKKMKSSIVGVLILILICVSIGYSLKNNARKTYIDNLHLLAEITLSSGGEAESLCNLTAKVWYNTIYEESDSTTNKYTKRDGMYSYNSDFNVSIQSLYSDSSTVETVTSIGKDELAVMGIMKELQNVPKGLENCYNTAMELHTAYTALTDLALNPSGSFSTFKNNKSEKVDAYLSAYGKLNTQIPEKVIGE